jgi:hypothetical protein
MCVVVVALHKRSLETIEVYPEVCLLVTKRSKKKNTCQTIYWNNFFFLPYKVLKSRHKLQMMYFIPEQFSVEIKTLAGTLELILKLQNF